jgi:hypothetical protein
MLSDFNLSDNCLYVIFFGSYRKIKAHEIVLVFYGISGCEIVLQF